MRLSVFFLLPVDNYIKHEKKEYIAGKHSTAAGQVGLPFGRSRTRSGRPSLELRFSLEIPSSKPSMEDTELVAMFECMYVYNICQKTMNCVTFRIFELLPDCGKSEKSLVSECSIYIIHTFNLVISNIYSLAM